MLGQRFGFLKDCLSLFIRRAYKCVIKVVQVVDSVSLGNIRLLAKKAACVLNVATKTKPPPLSVQNAVHRLSLRQGRGLEKLNKFKHCAVNI